MGKGLHIIFVSITRHIQTFGYRPAHLRDYGYLSNGVPIETVSKMLGHRTLKTTQHYAKILDRKISQDMLVLKRKWEPGPGRGADEKKKSG
jgi:site-specific recombinase XerD